MTGLEPLERRLGHRFATRALLERALTHSSFAAEHNERLEFLGDGVLGCAVAEELYARFPELPEGKLTRLRASLVREDALAEAAQRLELARWLRVGAGERKGAREPRPSILADALEAVIGAVFLDGGYAAAQRAVRAALGAALEVGQAPVDPKTRLQEMLQGRRQQPPEYHVVRVSGAAHRQSFDVECRVAALELSAGGSGSSRRRAEQEAARAMLALLERRAA